MIRELFLKHQIIEVIHSIQGRIWICRSVISDRLAARRHSRKCKVLDKYLFSSSDWSACVCNSLSFHSLPLLPKPSNLTSVPSLPGLARIKLANLPQHNLEKTRSTSAPFLPHLLFFFVFAPHVLHCPAVRHLHHGVRRLQK